MFVMHSGGIIVPLGRSGRKAFAALGGKNYFESLASEGSPSWSHPGLAVEIGKPRAAFGYPFIGL